MQNKTIIMGAGTVGSRCVLQAKKLAHEELDAETLENDIGFLFVDTRPSEFENYPRHIRPQTNERVQIGPVDVPTIKEYHEQHSGLFQMTPLDEVRIRGQTQEAVQLRPAGAAALYSDWKDARRKYENMISKLTAVEEGLGSAGRRRLTVWRVFHGSGGTGSGSAWLDAHLLRTIAMNRGLDIHLKALVIMPEAVNAPDDPRAVENFAALLKEHDEIARLVEEDRGVTMYDPDTEPSPSQPWSTRLYDDFILIAPYTDEGYAYERTFDVVSQFLFDAVSPGLRTQMADPMPDSRAEYDVAYEPETDKDHPKKLWSFGRYEYRTGQPKVRRACAIREAVRGLELGYLAEASEEQVEALLEDLRDRVGSDALGTPARQFRPTKVTLSGLRDADEGTLPSLMQRQLRELSDAHEEQMAKLKETIDAETTRNIERVETVVTREVEDTPQALDASIQAVREMVKTLEDRTVELDEELSNARKKARHAENVREEAKNEVISSNRSWFVTRSSNVDDAVGKLESAVEDAQVADFDVRRLQAVRRAVFEVQSDLEDLGARLEGTRSQVEHLIDSLESEASSLWDTTGNVPTIWTDAGRDDVDRYYGRWRESDDGVVAQTTVERLPVSLREDTNTEELKSILIETFLPSFNNVTAIPFEEWVTRTEENPSTMESFLSTLEERAGRALPLVEDADGGDPDDKVLMELPKGRGGLSDDAPSNVWTVEGIDPNRLRVIRVSHGAAKSAIPTWSKMRRAYQDKLEDDNAQPLHVLEHLFQPSEAKIRVGCAAIALGYLRPSGETGNHWFVRDRHTGNKVEPKFAYSWDEVQEVLSEDKERFEKLNRWVRDYWRDVGAPSFARELLEYVDEPEGIPDLAKDDVIEGIREFLASDPELEEARLRVQDDVFGDGGSSKDAESEPDDETTGDADGSDEPAEPDASAVEEAEEAVEQATDEAEERLS